MTFRDLVLISTGNLWRMKLRTFLTTSGVVIAIAAFVSMLSFGAGMQENISASFEKFGLFNTIIVYPLNSELDDRDHHHDSEEQDAEVQDTVVKSDSAGEAKEPISLNNAAIEELGKIPGVRLAYPFDAFDVTITLGDTSIASSAQALPQAAMQTKLFSELTAGNIFSGDSVLEVVIDKDLLEEFGFKEADSIIGKQLIVTTYQASLDSGFTYVINGLDDILRRRTGKILADSILNLDYWKRVLMEEAGSALERFVNGYFTARTAVSDSLIIIGITPGRGGMHTRTEPVLVPVATAEKLSSGIFSGNPADLIQLMSNSEPLKLMPPLFGDSASSSIKSYRRVTLDLEPGAAYELIMDSVKTLGFRSFSYTDEFKEIRDFFLYFNMALGLVGLIALITASLGIINTMVMSIMERRREIGLLKSLGADQRDIRILFLVESAVIGFVGAVIGIFFGWLISRLASFIAKIFMESKGVDAVELFSLPIWLIGTALAFGIIVSLLAGYYPAVRAGRVDPVVALRND